MYVILYMARLGVGDGLDMEAKMPGICAALKMSQPRTDKHFPIRYKEAERKGFSQMKNQTHVSAKTNISSSCWKPPLL